ncbi:hypothetical protein H4Q26_005452 [Puccinia striiformis f. sp. tritici PST-130]|nr:hypothetical protein H4Q26_005452 [Puccinia striiformis f. sp. tritici PST-130]
MSDLAGVGEPRIRSPSPGRGGRFDDAGRRSPPPPMDRWNAGNDRNGNGPPGSNSRGGLRNSVGNAEGTIPLQSRSVIPNYEREPHRERDRRDNPYPTLTTIDQADMVKHRKLDDTIVVAGVLPRRQFTHPPDRAPMGRGTVRITHENSSWHSSRRIEQRLVSRKISTWSRVEELRQRLKKKGREGKIEGFISRLEKGDLDILNYDYVQPAAQKPSLDQPDEAALKMAKQNSLPFHPNQSLNVPALLEGNSNNPDAEAEDYEEPDDEFSASMAEALSGPNTALASISPDISRTELEDHCKKVEGFDYLALSDPHTGKKLHRVGWVSFLPGTDMKAAEMHSENQRSINNFTLHLMITERPAFQKLRFCPGIMKRTTGSSRIWRRSASLPPVLRPNTFVPLRMESNVEYRDRGKISQMKEEMAQNLDSAAKKPASEGAGTPTPQDPGLNPQDSEVKPDLPQEKNATLDKKSLDLYIFYLRTVFNCCYYCVCVCDFQEELCRRCPSMSAKQLPVTSRSIPPRPLHKVTGKNVNSQTSTHLKPNENNWARTLDEAVTLILTPSEVDPREFGGERIDDDELYRKHIMSKHGEVINQDSIERIKYLNNYALDPSHTTPSPRRLNTDTLVHTMVSQLGHRRASDDAKYGARTSGGVSQRRIPCPDDEQHDGRTRGVMMGGPYGNYMAPMYPAYGPPNHAYHPAPMSGPTPMFPNGSMMDGHGNGGPSHAPYGAPYYMNNMAPGPAYPPAFQPSHHQVYSSLPAIPPPAHGSRPPNGNSHRLGDRISRHFAEENGLPNLLTLRSQTVSKTIFLIVRSILFLLLRPNGSSHRPQ